MNDAGTQDAFIGSSNRLDVGSTAADGSTFVTQDANVPPVDADLTEVNWAQSIDELIANMGMITSEEEGNTGVSLQIPSEPVEEGTSSVQLNP